MKKPLLLTNYAYLYFIIVFGLLFNLFLADHSVIFAQSSDAESSETEEERPVQMGRGTWDTGWFQAEVYKQLVEELGYLVDRPRTYETEEFYQKASDGEIDFWVNGWFSNNERVEREELLEIVGYTVKKGALQAYFIDKATAERYSLTKLSDLTDPTIASHFDRDGNGKADLIGCNQDWACFESIEQQLDAYELQETVEQVSGDYMPLMRGVAKRYRNNQPILFYTWTPNWTLGQLRPEMDVVVLEVPFAVSQSDTQKIDDSLISVSGMRGCSSDPCLVGFEPSDIRPVGNKAFFVENPAIKKLLELVEIPLDDIAAQNVRMVNGEGEIADIVRHATAWIDLNRPQVDEWLESARAIGIETDTLPLAREIVTSSTSEEKFLNIVSLFEPPFVIYENGTYSGFSIDLWNAIAEERGFRTNLQVVSNMAKIVDELERGAADVGIGGINITSDREMFINFSHPIMNSGLKIMVKTGASGPLSSIWSNISSIFSSELLYLFAFLIVMLLISAHTIWFVERKHNPEFPKAYWSGIGEGFWWAAVTMTTVGYGDKTPRGRLGRVMGLFWMFAGMFIIAYFTAGVTSNITIQKLNGPINGPDDLPGKYVATVSDTFAADYLAKKRIPTILVSEINEAYELLQKGDADAVVYDAVVLDYYAINDGNGQVAIVGEPFQKSFYGYALGIDSPYQKDINMALLSLKENGTDKQLFAKWFGESSIEE